MNPHSNRPPEFFSTQTLRARRFYFNLKPRASAGLTVVCGGVEVCAPEYRVKRSHFPYYSVEYVVQGQGVARLGSKVHPLQPGTLLAYGPGIPHEISCLPRKTLIKYFVDFCGAGAGRWLKSRGLPPGDSMLVFPPGEMQPLFDELTRSGERDTPQTRKLCRQLLECIGAKWPAARHPARAGESLAFGTYQAARQAIHDHFRTFRSLQDIARHLKVDPAYLCRLFRRFDHLTPYQSLLKLKMNAAADQLAEPDALVKNVAADFGFANPYHFSRVFKSILGLPPESFRRLRSTLDKPRPPI